MHTDPCEIEPVKIEIDLNDEHDDSLWINYKNLDAVQKLLQQKKWDEWSGREEKFLENNMAVLFNGHIVPFSAIKKGMKKFNGISSL